MPPIDLGQDLYFPSKRDWWIVGLIWLGVMVSLVGGIMPLVVAGASWSEGLLLVSLLVGMDSLMLWVLYGTGYTITPDRLLIRCGPFTFPVTIHGIDSITPTRSPWSSPACSLDRLKIVYGLSHQSVMISPSDKSGFLSAIVQQCPSLIVLHNQVRKKADPSSASLAQAIQPQTIV
jgi:hypothetical protein